MTLSPLLIQQAVEGVEGPRYVEAIKGARAVRWEIYRSHWYFLTDEERASRWSVIDQPASQGERSGGIPFGWIWR